MALTTRIKEAINHVLALGNLRLDSLTAQKQESQRVAELHSLGLLESVRYPLSTSVDSTFLEELSNAYSEYQVDLQRLVDGDNDVDYRHANDFFRTPDLQALYLMIRMFEPRRFIEVGCGNSTKIARQAILDGNLDTRLVSIDPSPRADIAQQSDEIVLSRLETLEKNMLDDVDSGDMLFIDSSHKVMVANDVAMAVCQILPVLPPNVVVHFHDIFLPYEYPPDMAELFPDWGEQYLLYAYLLNAPHRLLWPGYMLQQSRPDTGVNLDFLDEGRAQSFWFQTR